MQVLIQSGSVGLCLESPKPELNRPSKPDIRTWHKTLTHKAQSCLQNTTLRRKRNLLVECIFCLIFEVLQLFSELFIYTPLSLSLYESNLLDFTFSTTQHPLHKRTSEPSVKRKDSPHEKAAPPSSRGGVSRKFCWWRRLVFSPEWGFLGCSRTRLPLRRFDSSV